MNQILFPEKFENFVKDDKKTIKLLKLQFIIVIFSLIVFLIYFSISYYNSNNSHNLSSTLINSYDITRLYSANKSDYNIVLPNGETSAVIGLIKIRELNLEYPILSSTSEELLKISPCKFYGPDANEIGNLCIAGHNYDNNTFFSNIHKLNINSKIIITDIYNTSITYYVYKKFETSVNDISSTSQSTNGRKEITLITCNNLNGNRLIIKAKEKDVF